MLPSLQAKPPPPISRTTPLSEEQQMFLPSNFGTLVLFFQSPGWGGCIILRFPLLRAPPPPLPLRAAS